MQRAGGAVQGVENRDRGNKGAWEKGERELRGLLGQTVADNAASEHLFRDDFRGPPPRHGPFSGSLRRFAVPYPAL